MFSYPDASKLYLPGLSNLIDFFISVVALEKGGPLCKLNGGGPFLYSPLYHDLSAPAIKRNNLFHK